MTDDAATPRRDGLDPGAIRAVLFDLDGTLYAQLPLRIAMGLEIAAVTAATLFTGGVRVPRVIGTFRRVRERLRRDRDAGVPLVACQYSAPADALGMSAADVERIVDEWIYRRPLKWLPYCRRRALFGSLDWLDRRGLRKGVLSDYPAHEKLAALGVAERFDLVVTTLEPDVDAFKPDPRGFLVAAARWGLEPSEILYVGDRFDVDGAGARAAGMPFALLTRRRVGPGVLAIRDLDELKTILGPDRLCARQPRRRPISSAVSSPTSRSRGSTTGTRTPSWSWASCLRRSTSRMP
jgi:FMN phosphatase YigB (HAD superfamily)